MLRAELEKDVSSKGPSVLSSMEQLLERVSQACVNAVESESSCVPVAMGGRPHRDEHLKSGTQKQVFRARTLPSSSFKGSTKPHCYREIALA